MIYFQFIIFCFSYLCLIYVLKKFNIFKNEKYPHQNFASKINVLPLGGYLIIIFFAIFDYKNIEFSFIYLLFLFFIGALSDLKKFNSPKYRLAAQFLIVIIFIINFDIKIISTRLQFLDFLMANYYFNLFFVTFCFLILINGTNFIDGLNGLVILYYISIILILKLSGLNFEVYDNNFYIDYILLILSLLFVLNFLNKIYLGDSGSYLIGFLFAYYLISIYEQNPNMSPFFIILLLWYPCFENLFSIIRKQRFKKSAVEPDTKHFHQLLYFFIAKKFKVNQKLYINNFTSIIINTFNILIFYIGSNYVSKTNIQVLLICFSLVTYLSLYLLLFRYRYKKIK